MILITNDNYNKLINRLINIIYINDTRININNNTIWYYIYNKIYLNML